MKKLILAKIAGVFLVGLGFSQHAAATNYFNWGVESDTTSAGTVLAYKGATSRDCTVAHTGSCSMKLVVKGADGGNNQMGAELSDWKNLQVNIVGGPAIYYRWWMKIQPGFSWGSSTAKTKSSRVIGGTYPRAWTGYVERYGFNVGECDDVGSSMPGGGCIDPGPTVPYNMDSKADGQWHEYVVMLKPNTSTTVADGQLKVWIDGTLVGQKLNFPMHNKSGNAWNEAWGGWMVYPYFQLNGTTSDGGTIYVDDFSTDDAWNSTLGTPTPTLGTPTPTASAPTAPSNLQIK